MKCQWAGCDKPAVKREDGWWHCADDLKLHHDLQRDEPAPVDRGRLRSLHALGATDVQIAQALGCTAEQIRWNRTRLGLPSNYDSAARSRARTRGVA